MNFKDLLLDRSPPAPPKPGEYLLAAALKSPLEKALSLMPATCGNLEPAVSCPAHLCYFSYFSIV